MVAAEDRATVQPRGDKSIQGEVNTWDTNPTKNTEDTWPEEEKCVWRCFKDLLGDHQSVN